MTNDITLEATSKNIKVQNASSNPIKQVKSKLKILTYLYASNIEKVRWGNFASIWIHIATNACELRLILDSSKFMTTDS